MVQSPSPIRLTDSYAVSPGAEDRDIPMKISVIRCSHNPRMDYLQRTLGTLRSQTPPMTDWELLLVDNRSDDPLDGRVSLTWQPAGRIVREDKLELAKARMHGIAESCGDLIVFADDDNLLQPDYLVQCQGIADPRPKLGVWGARFNLGLNWSRRSPRGAS